MKSQTKIEYIKSCQKLLNDAGIDISIKYGYINNEQKFTESDTECEHKESVKVFKGKNSVAISINNESKYEILKDIMKGYDKL